MRYIASVLFFLFALLLLNYAIVHSKFEGDVIRLGMSGPFSGGLNSVGNQFLLGTEIYFKNLNEKGWGIR